MIQLLDEELIARVAARAAESPRRRINHNFHAGDRDNPHKFLNILLEGTYITPHRHLNPPKSEMFVVLEGRAAIFIFDGAGRVTARYVLEGRHQGRREAPFGIDISAGVWHTVAALAPRAVCLEIKPGPWDPVTDKEFARWAPREGDPTAPAYLAELLRAAAAA